MSTTAALDPPTIQLNPKQLRFIEEYLIDLDATNAAKRAGYSARTADVQGCQLLAKLKQPIEAAKKARSTESKVTREQVLAELAKLGFSNMGNYMKATPTGDPYLDFSQLTDDHKAALTEVTVEDYVEGRGENAREVKKVKFKLADKISALEKLGRHLGMFQEQKEANLSVGNLSVGVIQVLAKVARQ